MKFLTHSSLSCLALSCLALAPSAAWAQGVAINPYPSAQSAVPSESDAFQPDQAVILELLARQAERKKRAGADPLSLAAPLEQGQAFVQGQAAQGQAVAQPQLEAQAPLHQSPAQPVNPSLLRGEQKAPIASPLIKDVSLQRQTATSARVLPEPQPDPVLSEVPPSSILGKADEPKPNYGRLTRKTIPITEWGVQRLAEDTAKTKEVSRAETQPALADIDTKLVVSDDQKNILSRVNPQNFKQPEWSAVNQGQRAPVKASETIVEPVKAAPVDTDPQAQAVLPDMPAASPVLAEKEAEASPAATPQASAAMPLRRKRIIPTQEPSVQPSLAGASILQGEPQRRMDEAATFAPVAVESQLSVQDEKAASAMSLSQSKAKALQQQVTDLDAKAETLPAMLQEQALKRGLQAQAGALVPAVGATGGKGNAVEDLAAKLSAESEMLEAKQDEMIAQQQAREENYVMQVQPAMAVQEPQSLPHSMPLKDGMLALGNNVYASPQNMGELNGEFIDVTTVVPPQSIAPKWYAEKGQSAYQVLSQWSRNAGVDLIWNSQFLVDLFDDIAVNGSYEEAVQAILSQYKGRSAGVHGSLFIDEVSGKKTLVIETNQS